MSPAELTDALDRPFVFRERPSPTAGDLRPVWRVPVVLLLVRACRGEHATHEQLHVLSWAVRSAESADTLASFLAGTVRPDQAVVRFEPALDRAAAVARGFGLLRWKGRYWTLTSLGRQALREVDDRRATLTSEKALLARLPSPLSQAAVQRLLARDVV
jgi:hypothetical protein